MNLQLGIDENGLGPLLGPLVISGILLEGKIQEWFPGVADSKKFFTSSDRDSRKRLELFSLAIFHALHGYLPENPACFIKNVAPRADCLTGTDLCWSCLASSFPYCQEEEIINLSASWRQWEEKQKVKLKNLYCEIFCPARLNAFFQQGHSKSFVDFCGFAEVIRHLATDAVTIQAGKIGGTKNYLTWLRYTFPEARIKILKETHQLSTYQLIFPEKVFTLNFSVEVEKKSFAAASASLIGKFVRELFMESINKKLDSKFRISGYRDKKTKAFLIRLLPQLEKKNIPSSCLIRNA